MARKKNLLIQKSRRHRQLMNLSNYIFAGLFSALYFFDSSKYASRVIVSGYAIYYFLIVPLPGEYFYHIAGLLNLVIGCILFKKYPLVAILSFTLIFANSVGFIMYEYYYEPIIYNNFSLLIILMQIITLILGIIINGSSFRGFRGRALVFLINSDSYKLRAKVQKR